jgi:hypothetical protein
MNPFDKLVNDTDGTFCLLGMGGEDAAETRASRPK